MNKIGFIFVLLFCFVSKNAFGQVAPPVNDICGGAIELPVDISGECTPLLVTVNADVEDSMIADPGCADYQGDDLWYRVIVPSSGGVRIQTSISDGSITDTGLAVYKGLDCSSLSLISCNDDISNSSFFSGLTIAESAGTTVYVRVWEYGGSLDSGTFNICAFSIVPPPIASNDDCSSAISLDIGVTCSSVIGSNNATNSEDIDPTIPGVGCGSYEGRDVWYTVTIPSSRNIVIETYEDDGSITDAGMAIYSGNCGPNSLSLLSCDDDSNEGLNTTFKFERIELTNLSQGQVIYIRIWSFNNSELGTFNICAIDPGSLDDDNDGDGYSENQGDCNDANPSFYPGATEICDGLDNDCDGEIDEGLGLVSYYPDVDGDGHGDNNASPVSVCSALQPIGYVDNNEDCDDTNALINPDASEVADNGIDEDCDGFDLKTWYQDADTDTYGDGSQIEQSNMQPEGYVSIAGDCDDDNATVYPGATELCDGLDNDCDGATDEGLELISYYLDSDGDGFGDNNAIPTVICADLQPENTVANNEDCDDSTADINPGADEIPDNGIDEDCDGDDLKTWYLDADSDTFGDEFQTMLSNNQPLGYVSNNLDCNDSDENINPGTEDLPDNGIDEDCDGSDLKTWYQDADNDTYGNPNISTESNSQPNGYVSNSDDCNDNVSAINPDATEICDGIDNNCDGSIDEGLELISYYPDLDEDGYGDNNAIPVEICSALQPDKTVNNNEDCDDSDPDINPVATEIPDNGIDEDCDGGDLKTWYQDADSDTYGNPNISLESNNQPNGYVANSQDCNDSVATINPGATEVCDGIDNDCDGSIDEGLQLISYYPDLDEDGYGDASSTPTVVCSGLKPIQTVTNNLDCDDTNAAINPSAIEICDGIDNDCDGSIDEGLQLISYYPDLDEDGYGDATSTPTKVCSALQPDKTVTNNLDCDDANAAINPNAPEICDGIDNNCDGVIDEGLELISYYPDIDDDGFGDANAIPIILCSALQPDKTVTNNLDCDDSDALVNPGQEEIIGNLKDDDCNPDTPDSALNIDDDGDGFTENEGDCDDTNALINPDASEVADNGIDEDCDGFDLKTWYQDADTDTYGDGSQIEQSNMQPEGYVSIAGDCDDDNATVYPGATELCDGLDNDCDGATDEGLELISYYLDSDGDGFGDNNAIPTVICADLQPENTVANNEDCDDSTADINPGADEIPDNGIDEDCDGDDLKTWYLDADSDTFGDEFQTMLSNNQPLGYVSNNLDCNDSNSNINPGTEDIPDNGIDEDCDGSDLKTWYQDADNDTYGNPNINTESNSQPNGYVSNSDDCNDNVSAINPDATEICDGIDNNCDGSIDEGLQLISYYPDLDEDGYGDNNAIPVEICSALQPENTVANNEDCDDSNPDINPVASEIPDNGIDEDCDGGDLKTWYQDADSDNYGNPNISVESNNQPNGYVANSLDCNDSVAAINPGATEVCDGVDNDCDGSIDEGLQLISYYPDLDEDGYGDATASPTIVCSGLKPLQTVTNNLDCDDADAEINPSAIEICDGIDNDCDGSVDEGLQLISYYPDLDEDGFGDAMATPTKVCSALQPDKTVTNNLDCDDLDALVNPNQEEIIGNLKDDDCNPSTPDSALNIDDDGDGFTENDGDCDDTKASVNPNATDIPDNGVDENCDGFDLKTWYLDADNDSYGDETSRLYANTQPQGYVANKLDCNDNQSSINPGVTDIPDNGIDENCDGFDLKTWYRDLDHDNFGNPDQSILSNTQPAGYVSDNTDCNDSQALAYPGRIEVCDGIDNDCDGEIDEGVTTIYYADTDNDGYGDSNSTVESCSSPAGYVENDLDCDDTNALINPSQQDVIGSGVDSNCDGMHSWYQDDDQDGYGSSVIILSSNSSPSSGESNNNLDCDDSNSEISPVALEICDGIDNNCDGQIDEDLALVDYYPDIDGDGYGDSFSLPVSVCSALKPSDYVEDNSDCNDSDANVNPGKSEILDNLIDDDCNPDTLDSSADTDDDGDGFSENEGDCDDTKANINPNATEIPDNGIDENCDDFDLKTWYLDADGDSFGDLSQTILSNNQPDNYVSNSTDCNDNESLSYPGNPEVCDGIDNNCDGEIDEGLLLISFYPDLDGDGYGDRNATPITVCLGLQPQGTVTNNLDLNDDNGDVNPDAVEICDGIDNDSDGEIDEGFPDSDGDGIADCVDTLSVEAFDFSNIIIKPNPFSASITIELPLKYQDVELNIVLYDISGRIILRKDMTMTKGRLSLSGLDYLNQGVYVIKVTSNINNSEAIKRLIKF
ncbi:MopE-related protein [Aestuariibaculum lutulentum]|uniref:T9SS type A sorting domain-containing protein n=1 Tax=Aestuariibaculum lutulentum TaxID=2920935 RepID=A0ABS9RM89_9FLAO|nr:MopE-related protein [Aestuariibaculum lutulentum]MCH4554071.1 T9SS type A sorting domain-containing protein [Aestuariibaculum lutulentum]